MLHKGLIQKLIVAGAVVLSAATHAFADEDFATTQEVLMNLSVCAELNENQERGTLWDSSRCANIENEAIEMGIAQNVINKVKERSMKTAKAMRLRDCRQAVAEGLDEACIE